MSESPGATAGRVRLLLRLEGLAVLGLAAVLYANTDRSWWIFGALFLTPDFALLGYLRGPRVGAAVYNAVHSYVGPIVLAIAAGGTGLAYAFALIWAAHCGMDRAVGYGLKYSTAFGDTHLGRVGRTAAAPGTG